MRPQRNHATFFLFFQCIFFRRQNYVKTIHGYGMPDMNDPTRYGDIIVKFVVNYPLYLTIETMKRYANCLTTINNKYPKLE